MRLSRSTYKKVKEFCDERGLKIGAFVERTLRKTIEREGSVFIRI